MLKSYLLIAFRHFWKQKLFSSINLIGLSLGLACSLLIYLWVQDELSYDQFHTKKDRLFLVLADWSYSDGTTEIRSNTPANLAEELKENVPEISRICRLMPNWTTDDLLQVENTAIRQSGIYADTSFFSMLSYPLTYGNPEKALTDPQSIVISHTIAKDLFDSNSPLGETITLSDSEGSREYKVTGVLANLPSNSSLHFEYVLPYSDLEKRNDWLKKWGSTAVTTLIELTHSHSSEVVDEKISLMMSQYQGAPYFELTLLPYTDLHLRATFRADDKFYQGDISYVYLFSGIALLVLIVACINFINLSTARANQRATEVGIRKAIGAPRTALVKQFMYESLLTVSSATGIALLLVRLGLPFFNKMVAKELTVPYLEPWFFISIFIIVVLTTLLAGSYPSLLLSSFNPVATLKGSVHSGTQKYSIRSVLIVTQIVFSTILLVGTFTIYNQIQYIQKKNLGLNRSNIISFTTNPTINQHFETFRQKLVQNPIFLSVTRSSQNPISIAGSSSDPWWPGKVDGDNRDFNLDMIDYYYFSSLDINFLEGRSFSPDYAQDTINYILNEEAVQQMGLEDPVGTELHFWRGKGEIIGVVKDFHFQSLRLKIGPIVFILWPEHAEQAYIRVAPGRTSEAVSALQNIYAQYHPDFPLDYEFLDDSYNEMYQSEQRIGTITNAFTVLAVIISALGLLGMATYTAQRRQKEIGVRKVLGASVTQLLILLSNQYLKLLLIALIIAVPVANFLLAEWLESFAYHIDRQWWLFVMPAGLLLAVTLLSVGGQTLRAAQQNPVDSLRDE
ncbi:MAG: ABC transporter permease [Cyclobacteriaceae bacterium]